MLIKKLLAGALFLAVFASYATAGTIATFTWSETDAYDLWNAQANWPLVGANYSETTNGVTLQHGGRATCGDNGSGNVAYSAKKFNFDPQDEAPGTFIVSEAGFQTDFRVISLDSTMATAAANSGENLIVGLLDGVEVWTITPTATLTTYTTATTGDLAEYIDTIEWYSEYGSTLGWNNLIDDLSVETFIPEYEPVYGWHLDSYWTPHAVWSTMAPNGFNLYWWSGYQTSGDTVVINHRPGLEDLPENGGFHTDIEPSLITDTLVGGLGARGYVFTNAPVRALVTNEAVQVEFDWKMYVNGSEDQRFLDMFFSTPAGSAGTAQWMDSGNELGFIFHQSVSNALNVVFDSNDPWMDSTEPVLSIPLVDLGIDAVSDLEGDLLRISYTALKGATSGDWQCSMTISNKVSHEVFSIENVPVINADVYDSGSYFIVGTFNDLSNGDSVSGVNTAGYDIDDLNIQILLGPEIIPPGYDGYLYDYELTREDPNTGEFEDHDSDGLLNVYEYAYGGNMIDDQDQGTLPQLVISGGTASYYHVELKDPLSGITYAVETTGNIKDTGFSAPSWDDEITTDHDAYFNMIQSDLSAGDVYFYQTVITTNAP